MTAETWAALVALAAAVGAYAGYIVGLRNGASTNWLAPEVTRLNRQLSRALETIDRNARDYWQDRGVGR